LLAPATAPVLADRVRALLEGSGEGPDRRLSQLPILPEEERRRLAAAACGAPAKAPAAGSVEEMFEDQAASRPDAAAVAAGETRLSYADLNARAERLARRLRALGLGPEDRVGIAADGTATTIVGILGVMKAGCAYVPFDP